MRKEAENFLSSIVLNVPEKGIGVTPQDWFDNDELDRDHSAHACHAWEARRCRCGDGDEPPRRLLLIGAIRSPLDGRVGVGVSPPYPPQSDLGYEALGST